MKTLQLRGLSKLKLLVLALLVLGVASQGAYGGGLLTLMLAFAAWGRWGEPFGALMQASKVSWKWTAVLVLLFGLTPLAAGHGILPIGLVLCWGWERFLVPVVLGWLGIAALAVSPWVPASPSRMLALLGASLLAATVVLTQAHADDALLAALLSLPFLACLTVYVIHLARVSVPVAATSA